MAGGYSRLRVLVFFETSGVAGGSRAEWTLYFATSAFMLLQLASAVYKVRQRGRVFFAEIPKVKKYSSTYCVHAVS